MVPRRLYGNLCCWEMEILRLMVGWREVQPRWTRRRQQTVEHLRAPRLSRVGIRLWSVYYRKLENRAGRQASLDLR